MSLLDILEAFSVDFDTIYDEFKEALYENLKTLNIDDSVDKAEETTNFINRVNDILINSVVDCYCIECADVSIEDVLLEESWYDDESLEGRLTDIANNIPTQIKDTLKANKILLDDIAEYLKDDYFDIDILNNKLLPYIDYFDNTKQVDNLIKMVKEGNDGGLSLLSLLISSSVPLILVGIFSSSIKSSIKNRYVTLNNTEGVRANYEALLRTTKSDRDVFGYRFNTSAIHSSFNYDVCDVYVNANVGYGKGVYPKNKVPKFPFHPHCFCKVEPVYMSEVGNKKYNKFNEQGIVNYINSLDMSEKKFLFNKSDISKFRGNLNLVKGFEGFEDPVVRS